MHYPDHLEKTMERMIIKMLSSSLHTDLEWQKLWKEEPLYQTSERSEEQSWEIIMTYPQLVTQAETKPWWKSRNTTGGQA